MYVYVKIRYGMEVYFDGEILVKKSLLTVKGILIK
jgi:hypothetical protein